MKHSVKNFLVVFFLSIVIFAVCAVFLVQYISSTILSSAISDEGGDPTITTPDEAGIPTEDRSTLSYLILGLDEDGCADYILLTHIDRTAGTFFVSDIPSTLRIELDGGYSTLAEAARVRGIDFVREKVYALTALSPDFLFAVEAQGFVDLVDRFGGFEHTVPFAMNDADPERGIYIDLAKGKQTLGGQEALSFLQYDAYDEDGGLARSQNFRALMLSMCRSILTAENNLMRASEMLGELYNDFTTDMTMEQANAYLDALFSFSGYEVSELTYPGTAQGDCYLPDLAAAHKAYKPYRAD